MEPNKSHTPNEIARAGWTFTSNVNGTYTYEVIGVATLVAIHGQLITLNAKLDALGADGIHRLISEGLVEVRAKRRARLKRKRK